MVSRKNGEARFWICPTGIGTSWEEFAEVGVEKGLDVVTPHRRQDVFANVGLSSQAVTHRLLPRRLTDSHIAFEEI